MNHLVKLTRISRLYKLVKLTKLLRLLRLFKTKNKFSKLLSNLLNTGVGFQRLLYFIIISIMMVHFITCFWIILP